MKCGMSWASHSGVFLLLGSKVITSQDDLIHEWPRQHQPVSLRVVKYACTQEQNYLMCHVIKDLFGVYFLKGSKD